MWDELMGHIGEPTELEPPVNSQSVKAGRINDDGSYEQHGTRSSRKPAQSEPYGYSSLADILNTLPNLTKEQVEASQRFQNAMWSLQNMGFQIVTEGDSIADVLGLL